MYKYNTKYEIFSNIYNSINATIKLLIMYLFFFSYIYTDFFSLQKYLFFDNLLCLTSFSLLLKFQILFFSLFVWRLCIGEIRDEKFANAEIPVLFITLLVILFSATIANNLFFIFILFEISFIIIIGLASMNFSFKNGEACIKYFVYNTIITGIVILGLFMFLFTFKTYDIEIIQVINKSFTMKLVFNNIIIKISYLFFLTGLFFKLGVFPIHLYVSKLYESSKPCVIGIFSILIKPVRIGVLIKLNFLLFNNENFYYFSHLFLIIGLLSYFIGNIAAFSPKNIRAFIGNMSISQNGFLIVCISSNSIALVTLALIYQFFYNLNLLLFLEIINQKDAKFNYNFIFFSDFLSLGFFNSSHGLLITLMLFIFSGLPPFVFFILKFKIFLSMLYVNYFFIVIVLAIINVINIINYVSIIKNIWNDINYAKLKK